MEYLEKEFEQALAGRTVWLKIKEKYHFTNGCGIVVFPSEDEALNREAVRLLPEYREKMFLNKVIAVTDNEAVVNVLNNVVDQNIYCEMLRQDEVNLLLIFYRLVIPSAHFSVVSMEEPYGNSNLLREMDVDFKDFILSAIFKVR